jgi:tetratricopeptide (TPR) repeat protein
MRKINGKLFLGLLIGVALCTGTVFGIHHFQYQRIAQSLLWQAHHAEEQGEIERQARYLERYLEFSPRDDEARAQLGRLWGGEHFADAPRLRRRAVRLLDEVLTRDSEHPDLRRLLVRLALEQRQLKLARSHLEPLLPWDKLAAQLSAGARGEADPELGELEGFWGHLLEAEGRTADAIACCRCAVRHAPSARAAHIRLAYLLRQAKELEADRRQANEREADAVMDNLVRNNPTPHETYLARWHYRREFDLIDLGNARTPNKVPLRDAGEDVAEALQRAPESAEVLLTAADRERLLGQAARENFKRSAEERDKLVREHRDRAYDYLKRGLAVQNRPGPRGPAAEALLVQLLWHKSNLLLDDLRRLEDEGNAAGNEQHDEQRREWEAEIVQGIAQMRKAHGLPAATDYLQGRLLTYQRRWAAAADLFERIRPALTSLPELTRQVNLHLGQCYEQLEEPGRMLDAYRRVNQADADSGPALLGMALAEWSMGRLDSAIEKYRQLVERGQLPDRAWLDVVRLEMQRQTQQDRPDWTLATGALEHAHKLDPKGVEVTLLMAQLEILRDADKGPEKAEKMLSDARKGQAGEIELWTALSGLAQRRKDFDGAARLLDDAEKKLGDSVALRLARGRLLAATRKQEEAREAISALADKVENLSEDDRGRLWGGLGDFQSVLGNLAEARRLFERVAELPRRRTDLRIRLVLFDLAVKADDREGLDHALESIGSIEGKQGAYYQYGQALRRLWQVRKLEDEEKRREGLDEVRAHLDRALAQRPSWPAVFLARAEMHQLGGAPDLAIIDLQEAVRNGETSPQVIRQLAVLLRQRGRNQDAFNELRKLRHALLVHSDLGRLAADVALSQKEVKQAEKLLEDAVDAKTKDPLDLVWKGQMLAALKRAEDAEKVLRRAVELGPRQPETHLALVQFLASAHREKDAQQAIEDARQQLPEDKKALALAQCYEAVGGSDKEARSQYEAALEARPKDPAVIRRVATFHMEAGRFTEAEPLLRSLASRDLTGVSAADRNWARWSLAVALASGTDYRRFREALGMVGLRLDDTGQLVLQDGAGRPSAGCPAREEGTDEQRYRARVLASQPSHRQFRRRAIEILEALDRTQALTADDRFLLAVLHETDGSWSKAEGILAELVERETAPRYVAQYAQGLLRNGKVEEAAVQVEKLADLEKQRGVEVNAFASVELQARLLEAQGQGDKALKVLRRHIARDGAHPDEVLLVLASLARQKRFAEAFAECEKAWEAGKCRPEVVGGVSVALMRAMSPKPSDAQVERIETSLRAAIDREPKKVVLLLHLADLYDMRGRYADAEESYRRVLRPENEPHNIVALNNLAWLLVQRGGDAAEALEHIERAVGGIGRRADLLDTRGLVRLALRQEAAALSDLKEANTDAPTPTRLFHLARAHAQTGDRSGALKILREAREKGLKVEILHPIEQKKCAELLAELKVP